MTFKQRGCLPYVLRAGCWRRVGCQTWCGTRVTVISTPFLPCLAQRCVGAASGKQRSPQALPCSRHTPPPLVAKHLLPSPFFQVAYFHVMCRKLCTNSILPANVSGKGPKSLMLICYRTGRCQERSQLFVDNISPNPFPLARCACRSKQALPQGLAPSRSEPTQYQ